MTLTFLQLLQSPCVASCCRMLGPTAAQENPDGAQGTWGVGGGGLGMQGYPDVMEAVLRFGTACSQRWAGEDQVSPVPMSCEPWPTLDANSGAPSANPIDGGPNPWKEALEGVYEEPLS